MPQSRTRMIPASLAAPNSWKPAVSQIPAAEIGSTHTLTISENQ